MLHALGKRVSLAAYYGTSVYYKELLACHLKGKTEIIIKYGQEINKHTSRLNVFWPSDATGQIF